MSNGNDIYEKDAEPMPTSSWPTTANFPKGARFCVMREDIPRP